MEEHFGDVVKAFVDNLKQTPGQLAKLAKLPKQTIESWKEGRVRRPRNVHDILRFAAALRLYEEEADRLLRSAGHRIIGELINKAEVDGETQLKTLLQHWITLRSSQVAAVSSSESTPKLTAPFQAPPLSDEFISREQLVLQAAAALRQRGKICVLHGMAGVGKTALATQLAYTLRSYFPDGVLWADLDNVVGDDVTTRGIIRGILNTFAQAYGRSLAQEIDLDSCSRVVREILADKKVLLVLDNVHGVAEAQPFLPPTTESCSVLITTRNAKVLMAPSATFEITPFDDRASLALLGHYLGEQRLVSENKGARQIIRLLGGLPLALKIVASDLVKSDELTLLEYYELLEDERSRLEYLTDWQDVTKDVRASFELSFKRLREQAQHIFTLLHLFKGPDFELEAVAAAANMPLLHLKRVMGDLTTLSLVNRTSDTNEPEQSSLGITGRYGLHLLLRLFAEQKSREMGIEMAAPVSRLARYYAQLAYEHRRSDYKRLKLERENIVGVLILALEQNDWLPVIQGTEALTDIQLGTAGFMDAQGYWTPAETLLQAVLQSPDVHSDIRLQAWTHLKLGVFALRQANWEKAESNIRQSLTLEAVAEPTEGDSLCLAYACELLSQLTQYRHRDAALDLIDKGLYLLQASDTEQTKHASGYLHIRRGAILGQAGRFDEALEATAFGLSLLPEEPIPARISGLMNLGILHDMRGNTDSAIEHWKEGALAAQAIGDLRRLAGLWINIGATETTRGRLHQAISHKQKALLLYEQIGDGAGICVTYANLGADYTHLLELDKASHYLDLALARAERYQLPEREILSLTNRTDLFLISNNLPKAETELNRADALCRQLQIDQQQSERLRLRAALAFQSGHKDKALQLIAGALEVNASPYEHGLSWRLQAEILSSKEEWNLAEAAFQKSLQAFTDQNAFEMARTQLVWGIHSQTHHEDKQALRLLHEALRVFRDLGIDNYVQQTEQALTSLQ